MFIREIKKKLTKPDGSSYNYIHHRLVESFRTSVGPRQKVILNLGTLPIPREKHKDLANAIEAILSKQETLLLSTGDDDIRRMAAEYARIIIKERLIEKAEQNQLDGAEEEAEPQYETIDVNSASSSEGKSVGAEHVVLSFMKKLRFFEVLGGLGIDETQQKYIACLVAARMLNNDTPSERECAAWARDQSGIDQLLGVDFSRLSDKTLHQAAMRLWTHRDAIETGLAEVSKQLYLLPEMLILYDLTNTYFESPKRGSKIAEYTKSKQKRDDCPSVTLALVVDEYGFPKRSRIFSGKTRESKTLETILDELPKLTREQAKDKTVIIDAGIATDDNLKLLRGRGYNYIAVSLKRSYDDGTLDQWDSAPWRKIPIGKNGSQALSLKIARHENELFLLCASPLKRLKEESMWRYRERRFEEGLGKVKAGLAKGKPKSAKDIGERIGRLKERHHTGKKYRIGMAFAQDGTTVTSLDWEKTVEEQDVDHGEYVLRTSRVDLSDEEISRLHRTLTMIESAFHWMKSDLGLRPNYHQRDERMEAHLFVTVVAYFILAPIMANLEWGGTLLKRRPPGLAHLRPDEKPAPKAEPLTWGYIVKRLDTQRVHTDSFVTKDNCRLDIRLTSRPTPGQQALYTRLGISSTLLPNLTVKTPL